MRVECLSRVDLNSGKEGKLTLENANFISFQNARASYEPDKQGPTIELSETAVLRLANTPFFCCSLHALFFGVLIPRDTNEIFFLASTNLSYPNNPDVGSTTSPCG